MSPFQLSLEEPDSQCALFLFRLKLLPHCIELHSQLRCRGGLGFFLGGTSCAAEGALDFLGGITKRQVDLRLVKSRECRKKETNLQNKKTKDEGLRRTSTPKTVGPRSQTCSFEKNNISCLFRKTQPTRNENVSTIQT